MNGKSQGSNSSVAVEETIDNESETNTDANTETQVYGIGGLRFAVPMGSGWEE